MGWEVWQEQRDTTDGRDGTVLVLKDLEHDDRVKVWPALGFNCYRWVAGGREVLYRDPQLFQGGSPTRSGIPILFPFPNRIRGGRFTWEDREYQLPPNDSARQNAIHGFACRKPWRLVGQGADAGSAWVTGEFHGSRDAPETLSLWPADYRLRVTVRLLAGRLRLEAEVFNPDRMVLPFGLGYHPYFEVPEPAAGWRVTCPAGQYWELDGSLPTGERRPIDEARDLNRPRPIDGLQLDDVLTDVPAVAGELAPRGNVEGPGASLQVWAGADFREMVVFTPAHRQAVCLEPYTCPTDAINLQPRLGDLGWKALAPGGSWRGVVELRLEGRRKTGKAPAQAL